MASRAITFFPTFTNFSQVF